MVELKKIFENYSGIKIIWKKTRVLKIEILENYSKMEVLTIKFENWSFKKIGILKIKFRNWSF